MKRRDIFTTAVLIVFFFVLNANGQATLDEPTFRPTILAPEVKKSDLKLELSPPILAGQRHDAKPISAARFSINKFLILSAGVYGASFADMHETLKQREYPWWYEADPLARPLAKLPAPAYYATGFALATGLNWISWKMVHSRRWHKLAPLPQLLAIGGNTYGFTTNRFN